MAEKPIKTPLPADLPEDWTAGQIVAPDGASVGLTEQHGYNYLMKAVNRAQSGVNEVNEAFETVSGKRTCRFVVGTSTAGWTEADCDYLCDGTDDQEEIQQAVNALPTGGGEVVLLSGTYQLSNNVNIEDQTGNISLRGEPGGTILHGGNLSIQNTQSAHSFFIDGVTFDNSNHAISSVDTSLSVKNCSFINTGIHFNHTMRGWPCSFFCCDNKFLQDKPISEQNGVIEVLRLISASDPAVVSAVISNNIIEMTAESTSQDVIVGLSTSDTSRDVCAISNNIIRCNAKCKLQVRISGSISGNTFLNCDLVSYAGVSITGNRFLGCGVLSSAVLAEDSSDSRPCSSISGNSIIRGEISASGNVEITGNIVNAGTGNVYAIRIYKESYDASAVKTDQFPAVVGNYIVGGTYGILLDEPPSFSRTCKNAMVNSNRIYGSQTPVKIGQYWSGCMVTDNLFTIGAIEDNGTGNIVRFNSDDTSGGSSTPATVQQATPTVTVNADGTVTARATQTAGYVAAGTRSATHQLSSADDADLTPENIKDGVSIFGVQGTLQSEGGGTAGVSSFNGRSGAVVPGDNDYTAAMVGAIPAESVKKLQVLTEAEYTALTSKSATTLYLIKE